MPANPSDLSPHAGAVHKAIAWLTDRHRKGWQVAMQKLLEERLSPAERSKLGQLDRHDRDGVEINLVEWLLAEGQIYAQGGTRRISDYLIGPSGPNFTPGQRNWLQQLGLRPLRLYDVTEVVAGVGMTLCDTLNSESAPVVVQERSGSQSLVPGMQLACRLMRVGEHFELSGAIYPFSRLAGPAVAKELRIAAEEPIPDIELAHQQGLLIMTAWLKQFVAPPPMPTILDQYSGEPIVPITDHYRVLNEVALAKAFQGCADVEGDRQTGWVRLIDCDDGKARPLAQINPGKKKGQIAVFYITQAYANRGREWFDGLAGGSVLYLTRTIASAQSLMNASNSKAGKRSPNKVSASKGGASTRISKELSLSNRHNSSAAAGVGMPDIDPQVLAQAMAQMIQRTYANWADEPIPALDNKTPRQAIKTTGGLERVKGLLRSYEAGEKAQAKAQGRAEISYEFLWAALGVTR